MNYVYSLANQKYYSNHSELSSYLSHAYQMSYSVEYKGDFKTVWKKSYSSDLVVTI